MVFQELPPDPVIILVQKQKPHRKPFFRERGMKADWKWMITILNFQEERTAGKSQWEKGSGRREPKTHPEGEQKTTQCFSGLKMTEAVFSHRAAGQSSTHTPGS